MHTVYLVDDECLLLQDLLDTIPWLENGFMVIGHQTEAFFAVNEILEKRPDVVFCDLKMPGLDGVGLMARCREAGLGAEFVMLSAYAEFEASRNFFRMQGFDYLLKPFRPEDAEIVLEQLGRRIALKRHETPLDSPVTTSSQSFDDLVGYVTLHYAQKHSLKVLGQMFNLNPNYICNLFAKHYQSTLTMYITSIRMKEAARLIALTRSALKEVSVKCGYGDYFYFCKVFKAHHGMPPSQYREETAAQTVRTASKP